jgi:hypothetical protein
MYDRYEGMANFFALVQISCLYGTSVCVTFSLPSESSVCRTKKQCRLCYLHLDKRGLRYVSAFSRVCI